MKENSTIHPYQRRNGALQNRRYGKELETEFVCRKCHRIVSTHSMISGVQNRNHCPYCLHSRHVDHAEAGDRLSACKGIMEPVGLTTKRVINKYGSKHGELMLVHHCNECGKVSINRIARDDDVELILEYFYRSLEMPAAGRENLESRGIMVLGSADMEFVVTRLFGRGELARGVAFDLTQ